MFSYANVKLVENGEPVSIYDSYSDKTYAKPGITGQPGYFTQVGIR